MILLDSSGLIDLVIEGPTAERVETLLREGNVGLATPNLAEVVDVLTRRFALDQDEVRRALEPLLASALRPVEPDASVAWAAGSIRARHHTRQSPLSMCDALLIAGAASAGSLASGDSLLLEVARAEGLEPLALV